MIMKKRELTELDIANMTATEYARFYQSRHGNVENAEPLTMDTMEDVSTVGLDSKEKHGSPEFYKLLEQMEITHDKKSHDYASDSNPFGNYHFAGRMSQLFTNPDDAGFIGRIGEKIYRLANLENGGKHPLNEGIQDTEIDICVIVTLWMADRRERRARKEGIL